MTSEHGVARLHHDVLRNAYIGLWTCTIELDTSQYMHGARYRRNVLCSRFKARIRLCSFSLQSDIAPDSNGAKERASPDPVSHSISGPRSTNGHLC